MLYHCPYAVHQCLHRYQHEDMTGTKGNKQKPSMLGPAECHSRCFACKLTWPIQTVFSCRPGPGTPKRDCPILLGGALPSGGPLSKPSLLGLLPRERPGLDTPLGGELIYRIPAPSPATSQLGFATRDGMCARMQRHSAFVGGSGSAMQQEGCSISEAQASSR